MSSSSTPTGGDGLESAPTERNSKNSRSRSRSSSPMTHLPLEVQLNTGKGTGSSLAHSTPTFDTFELNEQDEEEDPYTCELCGRSFPNITGLRTHKRSHRGSDKAQLYPVRTSDRVPIERNRGDARLRLEESSHRIDVSTNGPELDHSCGQCTQSYISSAELYDHVTSEHGPKFDGDETERGKRALEDYWRDGMFYVCKFCGKSYLHIVGFRSHWRRHQREKRQQL